MAESSSAVYSERRPYNLWIVLALILICVTSNAVVPEIEPIHAAAGLLMVLFLPGYALDAALLTGKFDRRPLERAAVVLSCSISYTILGGLLLNWLGGLDRSSWTAILGTGSAVFTVVALRRRRDGARSFQPRLPAALRPGRIVLAELACLSLLTAAGVVTAISVEQPHGPGFTELSLTPSRSESRDIVIAVTNRERQSQNYRLSTTYGGQPLLSVRVQLASGASWTRTLPVLPRTPPASLEAELYKSGVRAVYRWVRIAH